MPQCVHAVETCLIPVEINISCAKEKKLQVM